MSKFVTRQCTRADCRLRFPVAADTTLGERCPHCGEATVIDLAYDSHDARARPAAEESPGRVTGPALAALLDNVGRLRNVGAMFRPADGAGLRHMQPGGITPLPAHP